MHGRQHDTALSFLPLVLTQPAGVCKTDSAGKPLSVKIMISDECPECGADHIDVQSLTFAKVRPRNGACNACAPGILASSVAACLLSSCCPAAPPPAYSWPTPGSGASPFSTAASSARRPTT